MSKKYIYARQGRQMTLYTTPEKISDNIAYKFNGPCQAGPIISNWEADGIGEWNEVEYQGKNYFIFELFDYKYSSLPFGNGDIPFIEAAVTVYSYKEDDEPTQTPWQKAESYFAGVKEKGTTVYSTLRGLALIFGVLYLLGRLQSVAPALPRRRRSAPVKRSAPRSKPVRTVRKKLPAKKVKPVNARPNAKRRKPFPTKRRS